MKLGFDIEGSGGACHLSRPLRVLMMGLTAALPRMLKFELATLSWRRWLPGWFHLVQCWASIHIDVLLLTAAMPSTRSSLCP